MKSLSEPDREVPLTLRLTADPACLKFAMAEEGSGKLATVSVDPEAALPASDLAKVHVCADPATEMAVAVTLAATGMQLPPLFPQLTADVEVHLVPYVLRVRQDDAELAPGAAARVEGDGKTKTVLEVAMFRVDAKGAPGADPVAANLEVTAPQANPDIPVEWKVLEKTPTSLKVELGCSRPYLAAAAASWGNLQVQGTGPGGRKLKPRPIPVQVQPLRATVTLVTPPDGKVEVGAGTATARLSVVDSKGTGVAGVAAEWQLDPAAGTLAPTSGATDAQGILDTVWTSPAPDSVASLFTGADLPVRIVAKAGPKKEEVGSVTLRLAWKQTVVVQVSKPGFETKQQSVVMTAPGQVRASVQFTSTKGPLAVAYAKVVAGKAEALTGTDGKAAVGTTAGAGQDVTVDLKLDGGAAAVIARLKELEPVAALPIAPDRFKAVVKDLAEYADEAFVKRLAADPVENFKATCYTARLVASSVHVQTMARALLLRRWGVIKSDFTNFCKNLAAALYSRFGEKGAGALVAGIAGKMKGLFQWAATQLTRWKWTRKGIDLGFTGVRKILDGLDALGKKFTDWFRNKGFFAEGKVPGKLKDKLPKKPDEGPFPLQKVTPDRAAMDKLEREAADALGNLDRQLAAAKEAAEAAQRQAGALREQLAEAERILAESTREKTQAKWAKKVAELKGELAGVEEAGQRAGRTMEQLGPQRQTAEQALDQVKKDRVMLDESCSMMESGLNTILGALNRIWNFGTYVLIYFSAMVFGLFRPIAKKYSNKYYPVLGETFWNTLDDLVFKAGFSDMFGGGPADGIVPRIGRNLESRQLNAGAEALASGLDLGRNFDIEPGDHVKPAFQWYYETIEANSFQAEAWECYAEWFADTLDWIEFGVVWSVRLTNAILAVLALIFAIPSMGGSVAAFLALQPELTAAIESMDKVWDWIKAAARGGKALVGAVEVAAVILPSHVAYTAKLFGDDGILRDADSAWGYPVPEEGS